MSGKLASFLNGSLLVVKINNVTLAYCQSISFNQNMNLVPVGGLGAYSNHALEPVQFAAGGNMRVTRWTTEEWNEVTSTGVPENLASTSGGKISKDFTSGNGLIDKNHFNPVNLLLSATFDIDVYGRESSGSSNLSTKPLYKLKDCRLTNYAFSFQPGSLLYEDMSFVCLQVEENDSDAVVDNPTTSTPPGNTNSTAQGAV